MITELDLKELEACQSMEDWGKKVDDIKSRHGGCYPDDWIKTEAVGRQKVVQFLGVQPHDGMRMGEYLQARANQISNRTVEKRLTFWQKVGMFFRRIWRAGRYKMAAPVLKTGLAQNQGRGSTDAFRHASY